jgi:syntaxin of plants SYP6
MFFNAVSPHFGDYIQVGMVRRAVEKGKSNSLISKHQGLTGTGRTNLYSAQDNDDYISSESDRQQLLMR